MASKKGQESSGSEGEQHGATAEALPKLDSNGFAIAVPSARGVAATANPMQLRMQEMKKKQEVRVGGGVVRCGLAHTPIPTSPPPTHPPPSQEEKAKAAKAAKMAAMTASFGGVKTTAAAAPAPSPAASAPKAEPQTVKPKVDARLTNMMQSEWLGRVVGSFSARAPLPPTPHSPTPPPHPQAGLPGKTRWPGAARAGGGEAAPP